MNNFEVQSSYTWLDIKEVLKITESMIIYISSDNKIMQYYFLLEWGQVIASVCVKIDDQVFLFGEQTPKTFVMYNEFCFSQVPQSSMHTSHIAFLAKICQQSLMTRATAFNILTMLLEETDKKVIVLRIFDHFLFSIYK
jgi:hypothetical protein